MYVVIGNLVRENHSQYLNVPMRIVIVIRNMRKLVLMPTSMLPEILQCQLFGWKGQVTEKSKQEAREYYGISEKYEQNKNDSENNKVGLSAT